MMIQALHTLFDFDRRATERVLDTAEQLSREAWLAPQTAGRGAIRDTLVHLVAGMRVWLITWGGTLPPLEAARERVEPEDFTDVAAVRAYFRLIDGAVQAFLQDLQPATLEEVRTRTFSTGAVTRLPLWQMMLAVTCHSMQHRSEVAAMLTASGHSPGELGMTTFLPSL